MHPRSATLVFSIWLSAISALRAQTPSPAQLIRDVRVFDGVHVHEHRNVIIENGKVSRMGDTSLTASNAAVTDGRGLTLLPGLIDAHVHMPEHMEDAARQALRLGVTTQLDMFNAGDRLERIKIMESEDRSDLADVRTAGIGATVPGGHPTQMGGGPIPTITGPEQAQAFVDARLAEGSDYIKIIHDDGSTWSWTTTRVPMLDNATLRALVDAAHKRGKLAVVHILSEQQGRDAMEAGADGLVHLFPAESVSPTFGEFAASHHVFIVPTLSVVYLDCGRSEGPATLADPHLGPLIDEQWARMMGMARPDPEKSQRCKGTDQAIRQLVRAHVLLLTGTDAPVPGATYGASVHAELALLVRAGLTPVQALAAATSAPAQSFRLADRGWIRPEMRADLLLVKGNPTKDILATRNIVAVWKRGIRLQR